MEEEQTYNYYEIKLKNQETLELWAKNLIYRYEQKALIVIECILPQIEYINLNEVIYIKKIHTDMPLSNIREIVKRKLFAKVHE